MILRQAAWELMSFRLRPCSRTCQCVTDLYINNWRTARAETRLALRTCMHMTPWKLRTACNTKCLILSFRASWYPTNVGLGGAFLLLSDRRRPLPSRLQIPMTMALGQTRDPWVKLLSTLSCGTEIFPSNSFNLLKGHLHTPWS
jgi:hypothetical protein